MIDINSAKSYNDSNFRMSDFRNQNLNKAYEISCALFRLAGTLPKEGFRRHLEEKALDLIIAAIEEDIDAENKALRSADYLLCFGKETGIMHPETGELILQEISVLNSAIAGFTSASVAEPLDREFLFPDHEAAKPTGSKEQDAMLLKESNLPRQDLPGDFNDRASKILQRIRQLSNPVMQDRGCRLRDIQEVMRNVSERTLRYDLQDLVQKGLIERVGSSGPATFYRPKND
jgi:hypothetical protein